MPATRAARGDGPTTDDHEVPNQEPLGEATTDGKQFKRGSRVLGGALAVAAAISLWVDLPKDPYVPKVIARNPMSSPLSSMILAARRSLDDAYALKPNKR